jgi:hypothetical protein
LKLSSHSARAGDLDFNPPTELLSQGFAQLEQLFHHSWIHTMFFRLWYGEAMAALSVFCVFRLFHSRDSSGPRTVDFALAFGLVVFAALSKPLLSPN